MKRLAAYIAILALAFGGSYGASRIEREGREHHECVKQSEARKQGNIRATHQKKLEQAIIESNEKAQKEIGHYRYPKVIEELKATPQEVEILPNIRC